MIAKPNLPSPPSPPTRPSLGRDLPALAGDLGSSLYEIANAIVGELDFEELFRLTVEKTKQVVGAEGASLLLVDPATGELYFDAVSGGAGGRARQVRLPPHQGIAGWVVDHQEPVLAADVARDPRFFSAADRQLEYRTRTLLAVPLMIAGQCCGVLEAVNALHGGPFSEADLEALRWLAPHVAVAVRNARAHQALARSREEVARSNEQLEQRIRERTAQIAKAKSEWETMFDAIHEPLFVVDGQGLLARGNMAVANWAKSDIRSVLGKPCYQVLAGRSEPCPGCPLQSGAGTGEVRLGERAVRVSVSPTGDGQQVVRYQDVTLERRLEQSLRESERLASVGQLAAGAAHEINNPMAFVIANLSTLEGYTAALSQGLSRVSALQALARRQPERALELLREGNLVSPEAQEAVQETPALLEESLAGGRRVSEIIKALKELALESSPVRVAEELLPILERAVHRAGVPGARVVFLARHPVRAPVEPRPLEAALAHVLRNALQASSGEGLIRVGIAVEDGEGVVTITDEGCGMSPQVRSRAFDPFFTTRGVGGGLGLGLTMAYGVVKRHGGTIELDSAPTLGTAVTIHLPLGN